MPSRKAHRPWTISSSSSPSDADTCEINWRHSYQGSQTAHKHVNVHYALQYTGTVAENIKTVLVWMPRHNTRSKNYTHRKKDTNGTLELQCRKWVTAIGQEASQWHSSISSPTLVCSLAPCQQINKVTVNMNTTTVITCTSSLPILQQQHRCNS